MRDIKLSSVLTAFAMIFLAAPLLILVIQSFTNDSFLQFPPQSIGVRWYKYVFEKPEWQNASVRSLLVSGIVAPCALIIGTLAAFGLDRGPEKAKKAIYPILVAPMVLPHLVIALGMLRLVLSAHMEDTTASLVIGHLTIAIPYVVITVGASLQTLDRTLEEAAQSLGARGWHVFFHVVLPGIQSGIIAGAIFAFIASFDEFIITFFLATFRLTLPLQIFSTLTFQVEPSITAISTITLAASALLTALVLTRGQIVAGGKAIK